MCKILGSIVLVSSENEPDTILYVYAIFWCKAVLNIKAALDTEEVLFILLPKLFISLLYIVLFVILLILLFILILLLLLVFLLFYVLDFDSYSLSELIDFELDIMNLLFKSLFAFELFA
jgi:hypothetical protein